MANPWKDVSADEAYAEAQRRIAAARAEGSTQLDLGDLPLIELPPELGELDRLLTLAMGIYKWDLNSESDFLAMDLGRSGYRGSNVRYLNQLRQLRFLDLSSGDQISDLGQFQDVKDLFYLDISFCYKIADLTPIRAHSSLHILNLRECELVEDLQPLISLQSLVSLNLRCCEKLIDLSPLARITSLRSLDISECDRVSDIQPLASLTAIQELDLSRCSSIRDLQPLQKLSDLNGLCLYECQQIADLRPLLSLSSLETLYLNHAGTRSSESITPLLNQLTFISLYGTHFVDIDNVLLGSSCQENVIEKVRPHFLDLGKGVASATEVKVFVLGNGRIGKTQLVRRLMGDKFDESISSTHGIQCHHRTEGQLAGWKTVRVNFWDFGGQDIYHGSHALFLHGQAIFVLLWTPDKETGEYDEGGMTMRNRPLAYWLDYVRTLAGTDCPVLVVQSQCDERSCERPAPMPAAHDFEYLRDVKFSAKSKEDRGLEELKGLLREAASKVLTKYKGWTIGIGRAEVRTQLRDWLEKDQQKLAENRRHRVLKPAEYEKLCESVNRKRPGSVSSPEALLDYLHQTGVVFYKPGLFGGRIILDQEWALGAIYTLFHRGDVLPHLVRNKGRFTRSLLNYLTWNRKVDGNGPYTTQEQELFLDMMQECGICFRANPTHDEQHRSQEGIYIAPELLPDWGAIRESEYHWTDKTPCEASATLRYRFLHEGVFRGLISKIGSQAGEGAHYGKQGCGFFDRKTHSTVLIEAVPRETTAHPGAGELRLRSWGPGGRTLIETILKSVPSVAVVPPEIERSWEVEKGRALLEIGEMSGSEETLTLLPSPRGRGEEETGLEKIDARKKRVYLSYAWGEEGDDREKVASQIITKLDEWGYEAVFDKRAMRAGDRISEFMKEIARGHKIVVIISGKYLRSRYCVNELESIFQRELRDDQEFLKRIVPVVLTDAKIHSIADRVVHTKHWKSEFEQLTPDKEHLSPGDLLWLDKFDEFGKHIGQILHLISDQLSPQNIAELTELDFEKIRMMLEPTS